MKIRNLIVGCAVLACGVGMVAAEEAEKRTEYLSFAYVADIAPGHVLEFEAALKDHYELHRQAGDPQRWDIWEVVVGDNAGTLSSRSCCYTWDELDSMTEVPGDREHVLEHLDPHMESMSTAIINWKVDVSRWPEGDDPPKMVELVYYDLKPGSWGDFMHAIKVMHELIGDKDLPYQYAWGQYMAGGGDWDMVLALPRNSWADFAPKKPGLWDAIEEVHGEHQEQRLKEAFANAIERAVDSVVAYRPDLSYIPESASE